MELLPRHAFRDVLIHCEAHPENLPHKIGQLWEAMDTGKFAHALDMQVRRFNGEFFKDRSVIALGREEIAELRHAAEADWSAVDPSIFGALLEQALDAKERRRLGAHYTPRAYVERLVIATVMEPLRNDWNAALSTASRQRAADRPQDAVKTILSFHHQLCGRILTRPAWTERPARCPATTSPPTSDRAAAFCRRSRLCSPRWSGMAGSVNPRATPGLSSGRRRK